MKVHHTGHHQAYTDNLNKALVALKEASPALAALPLDALLQRIQEVRGGAAFEGVCVCFSAQWGGGIGVEAEDKCASLHETERATNRLCPSGA